MNKYLISFLLIFSLIPSVPCAAYGEVTLDSEITVADETVELPEYNEWLNTWQQVQATSTANVMLTPGSSEKDLNFAWYSTDIGTPAVMISTTADFSASKTITGSTTAIERSNGSITYYSANHVSIKNYFVPNSTYYYRYTSDITDAVPNWSQTYTYRTKGAGDFTAILTADPQIGASTSISADTYSWNHTLEKALSMVPNASFVVSAGDQIDFKKEVDDDNLRESEYAGLLYPSVLRNIPFAAVIGNHDTRVGDYQYHFNNPNTAGNYGSTPAGCDYYFSYNNALFIVLNSNNRDASSHRKLMNKAIKAYPNAKWRIALFHHDIYGSGAAHADRTSANMRIIFAPLMDEFQIDLAISGHDHAYARSYSMLDGTAISYGKNNVSLSNPVGTTYVSLGTATGCKMFSLSDPKQFYVAERSNNPVPTFSTLKVTSSSLSLQTYDANGNKYADDVTIQKTATKSNPLTAINKAAALSKKNYTKKSFNQLKNTLNTFQKLFVQTEEDLGAIEVEQNFFHDNDPLTYYGYAYGTTAALGDGYSTLLDKTRLTCVTLTANQFTSARIAVLNAQSNLQKTTLTIKKGKKKVKSNQVIKLEKGKKLKLKIAATPSSSKVTCKSKYKKYVSISKNGVIKAKKVTPKKGIKKTVPVTICFENRQITLKIKVTKAKKEKKD